MDWRFIAAWVAGLVLASLAEGSTVEKITEDFPTQTGQDVRAVIAFAAASAEEDMPASAIPSLQSL